MDRANLGWLAGVLDGEGSLSITVSINNGRPHPTCRVALYNSDESIIARAMQITSAVLGRPCRCYTMPPQKKSVPAKGAKLQMFAVVIAKQGEVLRFLETVGPFMGCQDKIDKAMFLIQWCRLRVLAPHGYWQLPEEAQNLVIEYYRRWGRMSPEEAAEMFKQAV